MLPTPNTTHVPYSRVYEPAEDSFLLLDVLSSSSEITFLSSRFSSHVPLILEIGPGSGLVIAFLTAHADSIFGTSQILSFAVDVNRFACSATGLTVQKAVAESASESAGFWLDAIQGDLATPVRDGLVDVLVFNPPYVPTAELPSLPAPTKSEGKGGKLSFEEESHLLDLSYAGGRDGMETTERLLVGLPRVLSGRGCAYVLLCAQNRPEEVKRRIREGSFEERGWRAETVGTSGMKAGWEKLQVVRIWREG